MAVQSMNTETMDISLVVPVYNESENVEPFYGAVKPILEKITNRFEILMIDDGSDDDTLEKICQLTKKDARVRGLSLSRNFGHQIALTAGLDHAIGEAVITMDVDLQHPPELIPSLFAKYKEGYDIVYTVRKASPDTKIFKHLTSTLFYRIINRLSDTRIESSAADFRLMSRKAADAFHQFHERSRFTRGLIGWMGFKQAAIPYQANPRRSGQSKYTIAKMIKLALDGVTAFSSRPLRLSFYLGLLISAIAFTYAAYALIVFLLHKTVAGWTSILLTVLFLGGIQLITIGIMGEYLSRIFNEVKQRPLYFIKLDTSSKT